MTDVGTKDARNRPRGTDDPEAPTPSDDQFRVWKSRIELAKKARERFVEQGEKNRECYEGNILGGLQLGYSQTVGVNLVYVDMKQSIPQLYSKNPKIFFDPDEPNAEIDAEILEQAVNTKWAELKMKRVIREGIKNTKLDGVCAFKTYFSFKHDFVKDEWTDRLENDEVRTDVVPLQYLLKDPSASSYETSWWIGHEIIAPVDDIAKKFKITEKAKITVTKSADQSSDLHDELKSDFQFGTYYEVEDRKHEKLMIIVEGIDEFVEPPTAKSYPYDTMYDVLSYNDIPGKADPLSDYFFWKDQLRELAVFRTMRFNHAKKGTAKYLAYGNLTANQRLQLKSSEDSTVVDLDPGQKVEPLLQASIDPHILSAEQSIRQDIQLISKQAPRQTAGQKTATEVQAVEFAAQEVSSENLERLEEVMASIAQKWALLMQQNYSATRIIALTGMTEAEFRGFQGRVGEEMLQGSAKQPFLRFTKENIAKKVKARVKAGSTAPDNDQARSARLQSFSQFVGALGLGGAIDKEEALKEAVQVFDVRNDNLTVTKDNPMEESRLLNAGVFLSPKLSDPHNLHIEIHERESNGNEENILHILAHKKLKRQVEEQRAKEVQLAGLQAPLTGQSFVNTLQQPETLPFERLSPGGQL